MNELPNPKCGDCKAFYKDAKDQYGSIVGQCQRRPELATLPANMDYCHLFKVKDSRRGLVKEVSPSSASKRKQTVRRASAQVVHKRDIATLEDPVEGDTTGEISMDRDGLKQVIRELLEEETLYGYPTMKSKWAEGTLVLKPGDESLAPKEIPLDAFFHKIVMVRDRLRVLEAKLNSNKNMAESEKVELQTYISKCYGTLTTFNILFSDKSDFFSSK